MALKLPVKISENFIDLTRLCSFSIIIPVVCGVLVV